MTAQREGMPTWLDAYPMAEVIKNFDPQRVLFVDVGGSIGHQCAALKARYPTIPGRIILQDQAPVVANALTTDGVEIMEQDIFKPQKVKS